MFGCAASGGICRMLSMVACHGTYFLMPDHTLDTQEIQRCYVCREHLRDTECFRKICVIHCTDCFERCSNDIPEIPPESPCLIHYECLQTKKENIFKNNVVFQMPAIWIKKETHRNNTALPDILLSILPMYEITSKDIETYKDTDIAGGYDIEPQEVKDFLFPGTASDIKSKSGIARFWAREISTLPDSVYYTDSFCGKLSPEGNALLHAEHPFPFDDHVFRQAVYGVEKQSIPVKSARNLA